MSTAPDSRKGLALYKRLLHYAIPYWPAFTVAVVAMAVFATTDATFALLMRDLIDENIVAKNPEKLIYAPLLLILLFFVRGLSGFISGTCMAWIGRMTIFKIRSQMYDHLVSLPSHYYDRQASGSIVSSFTFNTEQIAQAVTSSVTIIIRDSLTIIFLFSLLIYLQGFITLLFLTVGPIVAYLLYKLSLRFRKISKRIQNSMAEITSSLQETIDNEKLIKLHGGQPHQKSAFFSLNKKNKQQQIKLLATAIASAPFIQFLVGIIVAIIIYLLLLKQISAGAFVAYVTALLAILPPLKRLTTVNSAIQKGLAAAESIFAFLDRAAEQDRGKLEVSNVKGNIIFRQVCFSYEDNRSVLKNININLTAGKTLAVVGKSGSGKSTLVNLLPRFYEVSAGQILLDGKNINSMTLESLRSQFALVSQDITLFTDTVANNIAYGALEGADKSMIKQAADAAHASEFINDWPNGFETIVGQGGVQLSGGQKQRLAIARALLKNAPILILDEATSALDSESEKYAQEGIAKLSENRTTVVIAHRLSTVEKADLIVVLENGEIVESGRHKELIALNQYYARYYNNQLQD